MHSDLAILTRRVALAGAALGATILGHLSATPSTSVLATAPLMWLAMLLVVVPFGARGGRRVTFAAWGPVRTCAALIGLQVVLHLALHGAPWMFGLVVHHEGPVVTPAGVAVHLAVALLLTLPLCAGQRLLARLLAVVRALLPARRRRSLPRPARRLTLPPALARRRHVLTVRPPRGPPVGRLRPAAAHVA
ncbi:MAG: hypothetical protein U0237_04090 [Thermoleophilia bacterium]